MLKGLASWASILGFLVSVYVLWEVRQIRKQFLLRIRINDLLNALKEQAAEMNRKLNDFEESRGDILGVFIRCESTLSDFLPKLSRAEKRSTKHLVKLLRSYHRSSFLTKKR